MVKGVSVRPRGRGSQLPAFPDHWLSALWPVRGRRPHELDTLTCSPQNIRVETDRRQVQPLLHRLSRLQRAKRDLRSLRWLRVRARFEPVSSGRRPTR